MKPLRGALWGGALVLLAATASPLSAAWDNVFQVSCFPRRQTTATYYYAAPSACCDPCPPQPVCTTRYEQRCYYQPVTTYQTRSYYEPVTTYRTSYYYEAVTSVRYSCYYDPCSCSYQQVATPTTCYQLRSKTCPVQSWVQRCCTVPVTTLQQAFYWAPVTSCCTPTAVATYPPPDCSTSPAPAATLPQRPGVTEPHPGAPGVSEPLPYDRYYSNPPDRITPRPGGTSYRQMQPFTPAPAPKTAPPPVRLDRIVELPDSPPVQTVVVRREKFAERR